MTDAINTLPHQDRDAVNSGLANPLAVALSIVAIIAAIVLAGRSVLAGDHRAHVWTLRLFLVAVISVTLLAVVRVGAWVTKRARDARRRDLAPAAVDREPWLRATPGRGVLRHRRVVPAVTATTLRTYDGRRIAARIVNVSMGGVAVEAQITDVEFAMIVEVGTHAAGPVRRTEAGAVFRFDPLLDPLEFDRGLIL